MSRQTLVEWDPNERDVLIAASAAIGPQPGSLDTKTFDGQDTKAHLDEDILRNELESHIIPAS